MSETKIRWADTRTRVGLDSPLWEQGGQLTMSFVIFNLENNGEIGRVVGIEVVAEGITGYSGRRRNRAERGPWE